MHLNKAWVFSIDQCRHPFPTQNQTRQCWRRGLMKTCVRKQRLNIRKIQAGKYGRGSGAVFSVVQNLQQKHPIVIPSACIDRDAESLIEWYRSSTDYRDSKKSIPDLLWDECLLWYILRKMRNRSVIIYWPVAISKFITFLLKKEQYSFRKHFLSWSFSGKKVMFLNITVFVCGRRRCFWYRSTFFFAKMI